MQNASSETVYTKAGVAPRSYFRLDVEGWRGFPHSYSIINEAQCLELLRRPEVTLRFKDAPPFGQIGSPVSGILSPEHEAAMSSILPPDPEEAPDATLRIAYPHDFTPGRSKTFVYANCDRMCALPYDWTSDGRSLEQTISDSGVTLITPSSWGREGFIRCGVRSDKVVVVPHGVDPKVFYPLSPEERTEQRKTFCNPDSFIFLHVSSLTGNKNPRGLLRAFAGIARRHPTAHLFLKGMNSVYLSEMWLEKELGLMDPAECKLVEGRMTFFGEVLSNEDMARLYQLSDAYVAPYQSEGFNMPALEAAACGLPLVLTEGGATDDFTTSDFTLPIRSSLGEHDRDGQIWLKTEVSDIEAQMDRAVTDHEFRASASLAGPRHVHERYSWKAVVDRLLEVVSK